MTDQQLLREYAESRCEAAFAEIVRRHLDFVYSAALRMVCDAHLAEDVTQNAFILLAQNALQLSNHPVLAGWLHCTVRNIAAKTARCEARRHAREQKAAAMKELLSAQPDAAWEQITPHLDTALGTLKASERDALLLRYFERKSSHQIAQTLGISDAAAQKRANRAIEHLRQFFAKRGIAVGASGLTLALSAHAVQAAPVGLAGTISTAAALAGTSLSTTASATVIKSIAMTTVQKTIVGAALAGTLLWCAKHRAEFGSHSGRSKIAQPILQGAEVGKNSSAVAIVAKPDSPFGAIYSSDPGQLANNLRQAGCPEETVKDILRAEINRKYHAQEESLRPKPADQVPWSWSAKTSEAKLIERREQAAAIARQKAALLRAALGYEVPVQMPAYAMTMSDQVFQRFLDSLPTEKRPTAQQVQDEYWTKVQDLRARTRGFWQTEDVVELKQLQAKRMSSLAELAN